MFEPIRLKYPVIYSIGVQYYIFAFKLAQSTKIEKKEQKKQFHAQSASDRWGWTRRKRTFCPSRSFGVRHATQTDARGQFRRPKCVAPLEMP
jgi:hypothetical protein